MAVSDTPFGPFRYVDSYRLDQIPADDPDNQHPSQLGMARDMNLFQDDDAARTGYIVYSSEENRTMYVSRLNASYMYLDVPPSRSVNGVDFSRSFQGQQREAPAIFKYDGTYYMITSGATGWAANPARYATAPSPSAPGRSTATRPSAPMPTPRSPRKAPPSSRWTRRRESSSTWVTAGRRRTLRTHPRSGRP